MAKANARRSEAWVSLLPTNPRYLDDLAERVLAERDGKGEHLRTTERHRLCIGHTLVCLESGKNDIKLFDVFPYDLSESGIGALHGAFVHPKTRCRIGLKPIGRTEWTMINGVVTRCRLVERSVHDVGIHFDNRVEISAFVELDRSDTA